MHKPIAYVLAALAVTGLAGCDFIRFPGDGGPPPSTPEPGPAIPPGAPGPPPPGAPVENPYGETEDDPGDTTDASETPTDTDTPATDPVSGDDTVTPPDTSVELPPETPPTDTDVTPEIPAETDTPPATDTPETDPEVPGTDLEPPVDIPEDIPTPPEDTAETPTEPVTPPVEPVFSYHAPGALLPGTGQGDIDQIVHAPDIVFPIKFAAAYLQSQVFTFGGGIGGGDQCDARYLRLSMARQFLRNPQCQQGITLLSGPENPPRPGYPGGHAC